MSGFITLSRKLFEHWLSPQSQERKYTPFEAWLDMNKSAKFICVKKSIQNKVMIIPRGFLDCTVLQLSQKWRWDARTVNKFLKDLVDDEKITIYKISKSKRSCTLVRLNNYNDEQPEIYEVCKSPYKSKCGLMCKTKCAPNKQVKAIESNLLLTTGAQQGNNNSSSSDLYGKYQNVHLSSVQYKDFLNLVKSDEDIVKRLIDELSEKIESKHDYYKPYDPLYKGMHYIYLSQFFKNLRYPKSKGKKPKGVKGGRDGWTF